MHSPMPTPPTPASKFCIVVSFSARNASLFLRGDMTYPFPLLTLLKNFWRTILPCHYPFPSDLDPRSMFSHISTLSSLYLHLRHISSSKQVFELRVEGSSCLRADLPLYLIALYFLHFAFYRRPFGTPTLYWHHCTQ
jgi:hypothetical protein